MDAQVLIPSPTAAGVRDFEKDARVRRRFFAHPGILAALFLCSLAGAAVLWFHLRADTHTTYVTVPVTRGTVAPYVTATGTVNPVVTVLVGTYVSGVIRELLCDFNTRVRKNQLCAKIDPRPYQTVVDQASANLASSRAQLQKDRANLVLAKITYERDRQLLPLDSVSKETVDTDENAYQQALAQITLDEATIAEHAAALEAAKVNLGYTDIVSPVDGTVVSRNITQGQTVAASFQTPTLFVIAADLTQMQVDSSVSESDIGDVVAGDKATFTVEAFPDRVFNGRVVQVRQAPQTVQNVVTYDVVVAVDNPKLLLKPGMTAATRIITRSHENVLRVPGPALRYIPAAATERAHEHQNPSEIWLLRDGKPLAIPVTIGLNDESYAEITRGDLKPNDQVIVAERSAGTEAVAQGPGQIAPRAPRL